MSIVDIQQLSCATKIDYSAVPTGGKKLPFTIELDLINSVLTPTPGEKQKFCYVVTGVGKNLADFADLSHFLFSICSTITEEDISGIQVFIDGQEQNVNFKEGGNVEIKTPSKPDEPTGCSGLKFDFPVSKEYKSSGSQLSLCFELKSLYSMGEMTVCLFGGNTATHALAICGPTCSAPPVPSDCEVTAFQRVGVCVPVTVIPYAYPGDVTTICCGNPLITPYIGSCPGMVTECTFTVTQNVCITVPLTFGAKVDVGEAKIECDEPTLADLCKDCI